jgi:hypothetical protein
MALSDLGGQLRTDWYRCFSGLLVMEVTAIQIQRGHSIRRFKAITDIVRSGSPTLKAIAGTGGALSCLPIINTSHPTLGIPNGV